MNLDRIERLAGLLARHGLSELACRDSDDEIVLKRDVRSRVPRALRADRIAVLSPWVGKLSWHNPNRLDESAREDESLPAGRAVAWIVAGTLIRPVRIATDSRLARRELAEGAVVGYGDTIAFIEPLE